MISSTVNSKNNESFIQVWMTLNEFELYDNPVSSFAIYIYKINI